MNRFPALLLALLPLLPLFSLAQGENRATGVLQFANRDRLSGTPQGLDADGNLLWDAPGFFHEPLPVLLKNVLELRLEGAVAPEHEVNHQALLKLTNGDTIRGQLTELDNESVTIDTWYGGQLKIRRAMASDLEILRSERSVYNGPEDLANWVIDGDQGAWVLQGGVLSSTAGASIAREIDMPEKVRVGFDVLWRNSLRFRVLFFSDNGETSQPGNCYDLVCQRRFVYLRKRWVNNRGDGNRIMGQSNIPALSEKEKVRMEFYIDRGTGTIALFVDGRKSHQWSDQDPDVGKFGNWLHFISEDFYPIKISNIRVSPWKGELPKNLDSDDEEEAPDEKGQLIRLQNGDLVIGEVGEIVDGVLQIKTKHFDMRIPVERMRSINLASDDPDDYEEPKRMKGDVRAWLRGGGRMTFRLDAFSKDKLHGSSQTFGKAEFALSAFSRLELNIYNEDYELLRGRASTW